MGLVVVGSEEEDLEVGTAAAMVVVWASCRS